MRIFIIAAVTADGFIARTGTHGADWTGNADKKVFIKLTKEAGTIVMGSKTFATIGRALPGRRNIVYTTNPGSINEESIETTHEKPAELIKRLKSEGVNDLAICGGSSIYTLFMNAGVVDELYLTIVPKLFGQGMSIFSESMDVDLKLLSSENLTDDALLLHYSVNR